MKFVACNEQNFRRGRTAAVQYIVVHYTANNGDTADGNARYFARVQADASAHFFVDEHETVQSVGEENTAWHCGADTYRHPFCRNSNSIGIELCSRKDACGNYYFMDETVGNAVKLVRRLMEKHDIDAEHVLRHYDVTGKRCPEPFVRNPSAWAAFRRSLEEGMTYETFQEYIKRYFSELAEKAPDAWSQEARDWAEKAGIIRGNVKGQKKYKSFLTREELVQILHRALQ